jgi:hypothetical protein
MGLTTTGGIKSIQRGKTLIPSYYASQNVTISNVDPARTEIKILGVSCSYSSWPTATCRAWLTNATTLGFVRGDGTASNLWVSWEVVEYF